MTGVIVIILSIASGWIVTYLLTLLVVNFFRFEPRHHHKWEQKPFVVMRLDSSSSLTVRRACGCGAREVWIPGFKTNDGWRRVIH